MLFAFYANTPLSLPGGDSRAQEMQREIDRPEFSQEFWCHGHPKNKLSWVHSASDKRGHQIDINLRSGSDRTDYPT